MASTQQMKTEIESNADVADRLIQDAKDQKTLNQEQLDKVNQIIQGIEDHEDVLYRVNCLQLLGTLATSKIYLSYLESIKVPQRILTMLGENDRFVIPHALKFFLLINPFDVEIKFPEAFDVVCKYFESDDPQLLDYGIDAIATIGRGGYLARKVLERHPLFKRICLPKLGSLLCSSTPLLKTRTLICIKDLLEVYPSEPRLETMALSKSFYVTFFDGENAMTNQLARLCKMPILEIQNAALDLLKAISSQSWAPTELKSINANVPVHLVG